MNQSSVLLVCSNLNESVNNWLEMTDNIINEYNVNMKKVDLTDQ